MDVILIAMPWASVAYPSIQLGILKSLLDRSQISCASMSLNLSFFEYLAAQRDAEPMSLEQYHYIGEATGLGLGEWIFASAARSFSDAPRDDAYREFARRQNPTQGVLELAERTRELVPAFLDSCAEKILAAHPRAVGFTSTFSQTFPSLALAKRLKEQAPDLRVVFGGANCDGSMGKTLHALYHCIDVVVRGESERVAPRLFRELVDGDEISNQSGLCIRENGEVTAVVDIASGGVTMDETPLPDYDEYFQRMANSPVSDDIGAGGITYESARGCWWGAKHHCTFCGLNGATMRFRSKPAERVYDELHTLSKRYRNLKKHEMRLLRDAGVRMIQPGIESLSTPPCSVHPICINRFSPYHKTPEEFGIRIRGPKPWYRYLHDTDEEGLNNLAYFFEHDYDDGRDPEDYVKPVREVTESWNQDAEENFRKLTVKRGPGFVQVVDRRTNGKGGTDTLDGVAGEAYLACERGATPGKIWNGLSREFRSGVTQGDVRDFLQQMVKQRLVFEENDHYLSLAVPDGERLDEDDPLVTAMPRGERTVTIKPFPASIA